MMKKTYHRWRDLRKKKLSAAQLQAIDREVERQCFLEGVNTDFAALRNNPDAWQDEQAERAAWDCTLADGLKDE
jgi:hypothetical protein